MSLIACRALPGWLTALAATILLGLVATASPARAEWLRGESEHFVVYGDTSAGAMRDYVRKVERFDSLLRLYFPSTNLNQTVRLPIYLADGRADMRQVWPDMSSGIGGFYTPGEERIFAVVDQRRSEGDSTLFHEYAHHFMLENFASAYPGWFVEGFAEYFATADLTPGRMKVGLFSPGRMNSLTETNAWVPMEDVLRSRSSALTAGQGPAYYAQAWALTNYLMSTPERKQQLSRYLAAVSGGIDPIAALDGTIDRTPDELGRDVRSYLGRITYFTLQQSFPPAEVTVTPLSPGARAVVWLDLRLTRFVAEADRPANLAEARAAAARYPDDPMVGRVLAMAALDMEDWSAARAAAGAVIAGHPDDAEAQRLLARALMEEGDTLADTDPDGRDTLYRQARSALARAYQSDPLDFRIYMALNKSRRGAGDYPNDNDLETLRVAAVLAPQVTNVRYQAAQALMVRGDYLEAVTLLAPVANSPHGGESLAPVRALLVEAYSKAGLSAPSEDAPPEGADEGTRDSGDASGE